MPFVCDFSGSPLLLQTGIVLLHYNQYSSIRVMNGPFPQPSAVKTNSQDPLIQISQCGHDSTTPGQCEGWKSLWPGKSDQLLHPPDGHLLCNTCCPLATLTTLNSYSYIYFFSFINSLRKKSYLGGNFKLNMEWYFWCMNSFHQKLGVFLVRVEKSNNFFPVQVNTEICETYLQYIQS